jgi:thiol-disulfide isomerase/thioredoxin
MNKLQVILIFLLLVFTQSHRSALAAVNSEAKAEEILKKVLYTLNNLKSIRYQFLIEASYPSKSYHEIETADCFMDFTSEDTITGMRFQISNNKLLSVFNGSERFMCDKRIKSITVNNLPNATDFNHMYFLHNSLITLKHGLLLILSDVSISKYSLDTVLNDLPAYVVNFSLHKKVFNKLGSFRHLTTDINIEFKIIIDKTTYLPIEVIQKENNDVIRTSFSNININPVYPSDTSWYYSSYLKEYVMSTPISPEELLIKAGKLAPEYHLPVFGESTYSSVLQRKGKVVLIEFWISNCSYCIAGVPKLNAIQNKYSNKNLEIISINPYDSERMIVNFIDKNSPLFRILWKGSEIAKSYGITYFPTVILLDKESKVLYSGVFGIDDQKLEGLIVQALSSR